MNTRMLRSSPGPAALTALAIFALPLLGSHSLATPAPWLGAAAAWLLLVSQPPLERREAWSARARDARSALAIFASMIATQLAAVIEYRLCGGLLRMDALASLIGGGALVAGGFALRLWSIDTLGRFFTSTVCVTGEHCVVRTGPYARVRHPSYVGAMLIAFGMLTLLRSATGLACFALTVVPAYAHRVRVEEAALIDVLGDAYRRYREEVPALVPALRVR